MGFPLSNKKERGCRSFCRCPCLVGRLPGKRTLRRRFGQGELGGKSMPSKGDVFNNQSCTVQESG